MESTNIGLDYTIKRLDLPADKELLIAVHTAYDEENGFSRDAGDYARLAEQFALHADIYHLLVLLVNGNPAGYVRAYDRLSTSSCNIVLMLDLVYILPDYRQKGLGRILMEEFMRYAHQSSAARIDLLTDLDNPSAVHLYETLGFKGRSRFQMISFLREHGELSRYFQNKARDSGK